MWPNSIKSDKNIQFSFQVQTQDMTFILLFHCEAIKLNWLVNNCDYSTFHKLLLSSIQNSFLFEYDIFFGTSRAGMWNSNKLADRKTPWKLLKSRKCTQKKFYRVRGKFPPLFAHAQLHQFWCHTNKFYIFRNPCLCRFWIWWHKITKYFFNWWKIRYLLNSFSIMASLLPSFLH